MAGISIEQMRDHLKTHLKKSQLLLVVAGNMDKAKLKQKVRIAFSELEEGNYEIAIPEALVFETPTVEVVDQVLPTNYIMGYFPAPSVKDADYYPMTMTMNILSWRLFEEVRTKRNLSYAPSAFLSRQSANKAGIYVTAVDPETTIQVAYPTPCYGFAQCSGRRACRRALTREPFSAAWTGEHVFCPSATQRPCPQGLACLV